MAEVTPDLRGIDREEAYLRLHETVERTLEGVDDPICAMATISAVVHHGLGRID